MSKHVLFLCTGNLCRSPLAEGILRHKLEDKGIVSAAVSSAGTFALDGHPAATLTIEVAGDHGVDISSHRARHVTREMLEGASLVVGMETDHLVEAGVILGDNEGKYRLMTDFGPPEMRGSDVDDPYGGPKSLYEAAYDRIETCVDGLLRELIRQ